MINAVQIREHFTTVLDRHAQEGLDVFQAQYGDVPVLSHACFKFIDQESFQRYTDTVSALGVVTRQAFGGKDIIWCQLHEPWRSGALSVEWLELVEPKPDANPANAIRSIGYAVPGLAQLIKIPAKGNSLIFRYQAKHARNMVSD